MSTYSHFEWREHEQVSLCYDHNTGLRAIIAIHNTSLGPSLGGVRMRQYKSEDEAMGDVLRLSRAMTYKAAAAGLRLGGGKAVIIGDPARQKSEKLLEVFGRFINDLGGKYIAAEDVGTSVADMECIKRSTRYVVGTSEMVGGSGDPSPATAYGVFLGMKATVGEVFGSHSLHGFKVAIQGIGKVGYCLAKYLHREGAQLIVSDADRERVGLAVREFGAQPVETEQIWDIEADIFAPCALGGIVNDSNINRLRFKIIAGAANNQLADEEKHGHELHQRDIVYAPDYVINAGGLINVYNELVDGGYKRERAYRQINSIFVLLRKIIRMSREKNLPTNVIANQLAETRLKSGRRGQQKSDRRRREK